MKKTLNDLAIFGGKPAFKEKLHVGRPNIGDRKRLLQRINCLLDNRWLTNDGPFVQEFEQRIADFLGVRNVVAMCNGTVALEIAIRALGLTGEVIIPSFTFIATAHALQWQGITPLFCDIDSETYNIDPSRVERMITPHTTGIIGVHIWGRPCDIETLTGIALRRNLKLLFDAAHAFGCSFKDRRIGNFGNAEVFSFHATKVFNTFEGGAVATNDDELAAKMRLMRNFGFSGYDNVIYIGTNGKMSEVSAAMGLTELESLDQFIAINHKNYEQYERELIDLQGIRLVTHNRAEESNYQYIIVEIDRELTQLSRDQWVDILHAENIIVRRYFFPGCHRMEPYRSLIPQAGLWLPITEKVTERVFTLPTGTAINIEQVSKICQIIKFIIRNGSTIKEKLHSRQSDSKLTEEGHER
jgi:dTDP-4-amino-4,6-dideoxygalactose transaminase